MLHIGELGLKDQMDELMGDFLSWTFVLRAAAV